jgi:hypothetical protein
MKTGEVIESAFVTKLLNAKVIFYQQLAGVPNADLYQELRIGFTRSGFKIPAERIGADVCHRCNFFKLDLSFKIHQ